MNLIDGKAPENPAYLKCNHEWHGLFAATLCPFFEDQRLDEAGLRQYIRGLTAEAGLKGLVPNGHTGEIMSLRPTERAEVTRIVSDEVRLSGKSLKVISGLCAEGSLEAVDHAHAARDAGADALLLMPPHHWLRFGRSSAEAVGFVEDVASAGVPIVLHQYPAWTKAGYSLAEMLEIVKIPGVPCIKMGTRDMARWLYDYEKLKEAAPAVSIITCHDEFLLPTMLEAADGALIGFAGFAPSLMTDLVYSAMAGDLVAAKEAQKMVAPLARLIYNFGEPGSGAHQRMKVARWLLGKFPSPHFRRPVRPLSDSAVQRLDQGLRDLGLTTITDRNRPGQADKNASAELLAAE